MSFLEDAIFPEAISRGSTRAPRFNTAIIKKDSGAEVRIPRWTQPLHVFSVRKDKLTQQLAYDLAEFFWTVQGATYGFRYKDWGDYATTADGSTTKGLTVAATDAKLLRVSDESTSGLGDGTSLQFKLAKQYVTGATERWRNIAKPLASTILVAVDGVTQTAGSAYTLDDTTGIVTFDTAPGDGLDVTWGGEFYVPARFSTGTDADGLIASAEDFDAHTFAQVDIEEIRAEDAIAEVPNPGGSAAYDTMAADVQLGIGTGRLILVTPQSSGLALLLPEPVNLGDGVGYFSILNESGSNTVSIEYGGASLATLGTNSWAEIGIIKGVGGAYSWAVLS